MDKVNESKVKKLSNEVKTNGTIYSLVKRKGNIAIYYSNRFGYEVIKIMISKLTNKQQKLKDEGYTHNER